MVEAALQYDACCSDILGITMYATCAQVLRKVLALAAPLAGHKADMGYV